MTTYKIPYDRANKPMYVVRGWEAHYIVMKPNTPFKDVIEFVGFRGTSGGSHHSVWHSYKYEMQLVMFLSDMSKCIPDLTNGMLAGVFRFQKRSDKHGIKLIEFDSSLLPTEEQDE
jgi:hypothetical protein